MRATINYRKGHWYIEIPVLGVVGIGDTFQKAAADVLYDLKFLKRRYLDGDPNKMLGNALKIREQIQQFADGLRGV